MGINVVIQGRRRGGSKRYGALLLHRSFASACVTLATASVFSAGGCKKPSSVMSAPVFFTEYVDRAEVTLDEMQFRSFRKDASLTAAMTLSGDTRRALAPTLPSRISFDVDVPPDGVLRFAVAVFAFGEAVLPAPVEFRVSVDPGRGVEVCFSETVRRRSAERWFDREVDLSAWSGSRIKLIFETKKRPTTGRTRSDDGAVLPLWGDPVLASSSAVTDRPNTILISIDCLRADHIGAYGYERNTTPNIDRLAEDGVVFETAVATSSYTHPTHMSMLTGLPPSIHGATRWSKLDTSVPYLPEVLSRAGYRTDGVVSVDYISQYFGFERGYHTYRFFSDPGAGRVVDDAIELVRKGIGQSQFLFMHMIDVHWPYSPPKEYRTRFGPRPPNISDLLQKVLNEEPPASEQEIEHVINLYDAELNYVDQELGRFFDELRSLDLYDRSLIIFTADHGEAFYEHGVWKHTSTLYEEMVHIPMIVKWPGKSPVGRVETMVSQTDVFPTVLEAAGLSLPTEWAVDLRRHLEGDVPPRTAVSEVFWDAIPNREARLKVALRNDEFKYIATLIGNSAETLNPEAIVEEELYALVRDVNERENLLSTRDGAEAFSEELEQFRRELKAYFAEALQLRGSRRGEEVVLEEEVLERLRGLGYVEH